MVSPRKALIGHLINAGLLMVIIILGANLARRLSGNRAAFVAAILIAIFAQWPVLIAWASGAQDLLAIVFVLAALHLTLSGKNGFSLLAFSCALLSKETAVASAPAVIAASWIRSGSWRKTYGSGLKVFAVVTLWAILHPGVRSLMASGGISTPGSYIGLDHPRPWLSFLRYVGTTFNIPSARHTTSWPTELTWGVSAAAALLVLALWFLRTTWIPSSDSEPPGLRRRRNAIAFGLLLSGTPMLMTAIIVHNWVPYYACFSRSGGCVVAAEYLVAQSNTRTALILCAYFLLGVWSRGSEFDSGTTSERALRRIGTALKTVEGNFKQVASTLPPGSIVYVSTLVTAKTSVYVHIHSYQVLRVWYGDPTIHTLRPELKILSSSPEVLFCIERSLNVFRVDPRTLTVRSARGPFEYSSYRSVMTSYALGLANVGEVERSTSVLLGLSPPGSWEHVTDARIAAMLLLAQGDLKASADLVRDLPMIPTDNALQIVGMLLTIPQRGYTMEVPALLAFGFSPNDPKVIRILLRGLLSLGYFDVSERLANRLLVLVPQDAEAREALKRIRGEHRINGTQMVPQIDRGPFQAEDK